MSGPAGAGQPWQVSPGLQGEGLRNNCSSTQCWGTGPRAGGTTSKDLYVVDIVSSPSKMEHDPSFLCVQLACSVQSVQTSYPSPVFHGNTFNPQGQRPCCWVGWWQALCGALVGPLPQPFLMATVHPQVAGNIEWSGMGGQAAGATGQGPWVPPLAVGVGHLRTHLAARPVRAVHTDPRTKGGRHIATL